MAQVFPVPAATRSRATKLLATIGNTPLLRLDAIAAEYPGVEIFAKAEYFNPGGSVKDRPALNMILDGERSGKLNPHRTILDATSGNTGHRLRHDRARRAATRSSCPARQRLPGAQAYPAGYGAEMVFTDPAEGSDGAIRKCREIYEADPDLYFYPDQYNNPANWKAHYDTTGPEIIEQTGGRITHFVAAWAPAAPSPASRGACGAICRDVKCISAQPASGFHGLEGLKHMPTAIVPGIYDERLADGNLWIETEDAYRMVRRLAREEGMLAGISSGRERGGGDGDRARPGGARRPGVIVTVLCDSADKYLSEHFWDEE